MIKCTIAIPVYNRENLIRRAIDSALAQDVSDLEILVVDNCSTDNTWDVLQTYRDSRLHLVRNKYNVGLFGNFNCCLSLAQGKYLRFLCSDDKLIHGCLGREIEIMNAYPNVVLLSTRGRRIDEAGRFLGMQGDHFQSGIYFGHQAIHAVLWFQAHYAYNPLNYPSGILLRREVALKTGQFDTTMRMSGDVDFFLRILEYGDLIVMDTLGCEIMIHTKQEGAQLTGDTAPMLELYALVERYRQLLEQAGTYPRIKQQLAAYALGLGFKYWRIGLLDASRAHCKIVLNNGVHKLETVMPILRLLGLRLILKTTGIRLMPIHPSRSLRRDYAG
jgi:hypothetical protein